MASTITLANSVSYAQTYARYKPLTVGTNNEPAITSANIILQAFLSPMFRWNWNRKTVQFLTTAGTQDYVTAVSPEFGYIEKATFVPAGVVTFVARAAGVATITVTNSFKVGDPVVVTGVTNDSSSFNAVGTIITATSSQFTMANTAGTATVTTVAATGSIPWAAAGTIREIPTMQPVLSIDSNSGQPVNLAPEINDNAGNITFRFQPIPDAVYLVNIIYQAAPSLMTTLSSTWAPIPDYYQYIYQNGFIALMLAAVGDQRWVQFNQKFVGGILGVAQGLNETEKNIFMQTWSAMITEQQVNGMRAQAGAQGIA